MYMDYGFGSGFGTGFGVFSFFFFLMFGLVFLFIIINLVRGIGQWNKNNNSPRLTVDATVVSKRIDVSHHRHANAGDATGVHGYHTSTSTRYFATFEVESGDRMELNVGGDEYGMLVEGDYGKLTFQGTRYLTFERR